MKAKLLTLVAAVLSVMCMMSSCNYIVPDLTGLISPPKASGEYYHIQKALTRFVGGTINLKYPTGGDNKTPFLVQDLDGDGVEEAVAFYALAGEDKKVAPVHINLLINGSDGWISTSDITARAGDIDKVVVSDVTGDGKQELLIGFDAFSSIGNTLVVYSFRSDKLVEVLNEEYSDYVLADLTDDGNQELLLLSHRATEKKADAKLYSFVSGNLLLKGTVQLDGNISGFAEIKVGKLTDGHTAVYIDSHKGVASMVTDIVFVNNGTLVNPMYDPMIMENQSTLRNSTEISRDIDGDGFIEVPFTSLMPGYETVASADAAYMYKWGRYDGLKFNVVYSGDYSPEFGYAMLFPPLWEGSVTVVVDKANNMRSYRLWDSVAGTTGAEILRTRVYSVEEFAAVDSDEIIELARDDTRVYAARIVPASAEYLLTEQDVKNMFFRFS